jgi:hypothetical protein
MNTFVKVVLLGVAAIIALKLLPLTLALGCVLAAGFFGLVAVGVSAIAALLGAAIVFAAVSSPVWLPVLVAVGIIALCKRGGRPPPTISA